MTNNSNIKIIREEEYIASTTLNGDTNYSAIDLKDVSTFQIQFIFSNGSSFNATLELEVSSDASNWDPVTGTSQYIDGTSGSHTWEIESASRYVRVTAGSITGSATVTANFVGRA